MLPHHPRRRRGLVLSAAYAVIAAGALTVPTTTAAASPVTPTQPAAAALAGAPGSVVFIRQHNVWLAAPDGSKQRQLTRNGTSSKPYQSPSQSDTGVIAVGHGQDITLLRQNGTVIRRLNPGPLVSGVGHPLDGPPVNVAISPNGTKVAYTFASYQCPVAAPCGAQRATAVTSTSSLTPASVHGQTHYWDPSWVRNSRMIQSGGYLHQVRLVDLGAKPQQWFDDVDLPEVPYGMGTDLTDVELSPDGRWLGAVRGYGDGTHIVHYRVQGNPFSGPPPAVPDWLCATSFLKGLGSPTFSPDSRTMMWHEPDGLWALSQLGEPCVNPKLVIRNASQPDWSAAPVSPVSSGPRKFTVTRKPKVTGPARVGVRLRVQGSWTPRATKIGYTWLRNGKTIPGARGARYQVRKKDIGKRISARLRLTAPNTIARVVKAAPSARVRR